MTSSSPRVESGTFVGGIDAATFLIAVDAHMADLLGRRSGLVVEAARRSIDAGGKRMRPLLVAAARPLDDETRLDPSSDVFESLVRAGAAIELVHTASLVHDDILDGASLRRGIPTVGSVDGRAIATAAGDLLFSLAFATLTELRPLVDATTAHDAVRVLARTARELAEGEALQAQQTRNPGISVAEYEHRCALKTGVLFGAALHLGALLGGAHRDDVTTLGAFGVRVGVAFQIADDVLDCGDPSVEAILGKRPGADLRDGTITLPMLEALPHDVELGVRLASVVPNESVEPMLDRIRDTGALDRARHRALHIRDEAETMLDSLMGTFDTGPLVAIASQAVQRIA